MAHPAPQGPAGHGALCSRPCPTCTQLFHAAFPMPPRPASPTTEKTAAASPTRGLCARDPSCLQLGQSPGRVCTHGPAQEDQPPSPQEKDKGHTGANPTPAVSAERNRRVQSRVHTSGSVALDLQPHHTTNGPAQMDALPQAGTGAVALAVLKASSSPCVTRAAEATAH